MAALGHSDGSFVYTICKMPDSVAMQSFCQRMGTAAQVPRKTPGERKTLATAWNGNFFLARAW